MKSTLSIGRFDGGYVVRLDGRGGVNESSTLRDYVQLILTGDRSRVVLDLNFCDYLDSTFLGCMVGLHKKHGGDGEPRFIVAAFDATRDKLLCGTNIDKFLEMIESAPELVEGFQPISGPTLGTRDMGRHVMECHQLLSTLGGPDADTFADIAKKLGRELEQSQRGRFGDQGM